MRRTAKGFGAALGAALVTLAAAPQARADASVVTSIKPVHSLAAMVMEGIGEPFLILKGAASPHAYTMRPSEARALDGADVVFWIGPGLEAFLAKPIAALEDGARVVALAEAEGMTLLPTREGGTWEGHSHDGEHGHDGHGHDEHGHDEHGHEEHGHEDEHDEHGGADMHLWLDPGNASAMLRAMATSLAEADPTNADRYRANAAAAAARVEALDAELSAALAPVRDVPYVVFHDAYQYFERRYRLNAIGSITVAPGRNPGASRLYDIRSKILELGAACVFAEPQFEPALVATVIEGTTARSGVLDPIGADIPRGPDAYPALMRGLADGLVDCLDTTG